MLNDDLFFLLSGDWHAILANNLWSILMVSLAMLEVQLISPGKAITTTALKAAKDFEKNYPIHLLIAPHATQQYYYFAGTDEQRVEDLQNALDNPNLDYIWCASGGYGVIRLIEHLNFSRFKNNKSLLIGFSDITILHCKMQTLNRPTLHACMPSSLSKSTQKTKQSLSDALFRKSLQYHGLFSQYNRLGQVTAPVVGGNLSILTSLIGTDLEINTVGNILFIEEVNESIHKIERMIFQLKLSGKFKHLKGLIIGQLTQISDTSIPFEASVHAVIAQQLQAYRFPISFNFPAGHESDNYAFLLNYPATLTVTEQGSSFTQAALNSASLPS